MYRCAGAEVTFAAATLAWLLLPLGIAACQVRAPPPSDVRALVLPPVDASTPRSAPGASGKALAVGYTSAGTLIVQTSGGLNAYTRGLGEAPVELPLPAHLSEMFGVAPRDTAAIAFPDDENGRHDMLIVSFAPLALVGRVTGQPAGDLAWWGVVEDDPEHSGRHLGVAVMASPVRTLVHLLVPSGLDARVDHLDVSPTGRFAVVTMRVKEPTSTRFRAFSYDLADGKRLAEVFGGEKSASVYVDDQQLAFRDDELVAVDLATGRTTAHVPAPCPTTPATSPALGRENMRIDESHQRVLATCNRDGELYDARTLRLLQTYPSLLPPCENRELLPAYFRDDGTMLVMQACDGEARLDLTTARYRCADSPKLLGPNTGSPSVPRCHAASEGYQIGYLFPISPHWQQDDEPGAVGVAIGPGGARVTIGREGKVAAVSPAEDQLATIENSRVIVRALPSGTVLRELSY